MLQRPWQRFPGVEETTPEKKQTKQKLQNHFPPTITNTERVHFPPCSKSCRIPSSNRPWDPFPRLAGPRVYGWTMSSNGFPDAPTNVFMPTLQWSEMKCMHQRAPQFPWSPQTRTNAIGIAFPERNPSVLVPIKLKSKALRKSILQDFCLHGARKAFTVDLMLPCE